MGNLILWRKEHLFTRFQGLDVLKSAFYLGLGSGVHFSGSKNQPPRPPSSGSSGSGGDKDLAGNLELGELGQLTITNDNESTYDVSLKVCIID